LTGPTAVIAEDEPLLRSELHERLSVQWPELNVRAAVADGAEAIRAFERFAPQILFLDIHLPGVNGLEVAQHASGKAHVVFITAYDHYALTAFEQGAIDYILKPLSPERLALTIVRLKERLHGPPSPVQGLAELLRSGNTGETRYLKWLTVPSGSALRLVTSAEILYLRAENKYVSIATNTGVFLLSTSLTHMKQRLDPERFWQIHRSYIVNVAAIHTIHRSFRGGFEIKLKERSEILPVSAAHAHLFAPP
jgi:DNA-binding LytR/AlgR family response regulator